MSCNDDQKDFPHLKICELLVYEVDQYSVKIQESFAYVMMIHSKRDAMDKLEEALRKSGAKYGFFRVDQTVSDWRSIKPYVCYRRLHSSGLSLSTNKCELLTFLIKYDGTHILHKDTTESETLHQLQSRQFETINHDFEGSLSHHFCQLMISFNDSLTADDFDDASDCDDELVEDIYAVTPLLLHEPIFDRLETIIRESDHLRLQKDKTYRLLVAQSKSDVSNFQTYDMREMFFNKNIPYQTMFRINYTNCQLDLDSIDILED